MKTIDRTDVLAAGTRRTVEALDERQLYAWARKHDPELHETLIEHDNELSQLRTDRAIILGELRLRIQERRR